MRAEDPALKRDRLSWVSQNYIREETLTAANALNALIKERRYSLFVEGGHRWIDARRFNRLGSLPIDRTGDAPPTSLPRPVPEVPGS